MMTADARGAHGNAGREAFAVPPPLIALGGALTAGLCLLLLLGPFYEDHAAPADRLQGWLLMLLDGRGPFELQQLVRNRFSLLMILLFGTVLILLPWRRAVLLQRERRGVSQTAQEPADAAERTAPHRGRPERPAVFLAGGEETIRHSVAELGEMARSAGVRWRPDYATEGGARGLLEVLRVLEDGAAPEEALPPEPAQAPAPHTEAVVEAVTEPPPAEQNAPDAEDLSGGYEVGAPTWTPSYSGSVYTSTTLYGAESNEDEDEDKAEDDADGRGER